MDNTKRNQIKKLYCLIELDLSTKLSKCRYYNENYYHVLKFIEDNYKNYQIKLQYNKNRKIKYQLCRELNKGYIYDNYSDKYILQILNVFNPE